MTMLFLLLDILRQRFYDITLGVAIVKKFIFPVKARAMRAESVDFTYHSTIVFFLFFFNKILKTFSLKNIFKRRNGK